MAEPAGYVDLQVNGCFGIDFNSPGLTADLWRRAREGLAARGVRGFLATVITDELGPLCEKIAAIAELVESQSQDGSGGAECLGIHVEGPFISAEPGYIGAHRATCARDADPSSFGRILEAGRGKVRMLTLAPERAANLQCIDLLCSAGVLVAAGHTDASREQLSAAVDAGLRAFTHLGNGCPVMLPRHDNIIARAWSLAGRLDVTLIADSIHVPPWWLDTCVRHFGFEHVTIVSDAMAAAGLGPGVDRLGDQDIRVDASGRATRDGSGNLAGAARLMDDAESLLREQLGYSPQQLDQLLRLNPRTWIRRDLP